MQLKNKKLITRFNDLQNLCIDLKKSHKKITMTNGCFDILHSGHTYFLEEAKSLGDILIVALNSDNSVKRLKPNRPIVSELDRAYVLSCLSSVDYIFIFDEDTPEKIICDILPDILVKGSDYSGKNIAGEGCLRKNNKEVKLIQLLDGKSSSSIINKISEI